MTSDRRGLPSGEEVPFAEIESALAHSAHAGESPRARTATVVVIGPAGRLGEAAGALEELSTRAGFRAILVSTDEHGTPSARLADNTVVIEGLKKAHVNNAVAALRLSSLPTLVWWRGGDVETLAALAPLADRLLLDAEDPSSGWALAGRLASMTAISDLRWTRLTRWRALMAHFFDIPEVRAVAPGFGRLELAGADRYALRLFAGWLVSSLPAGAGLTVAMSGDAVAEPVERVRLTGGGQELELRLLPAGACVATAARVEGHAGASRIVSLGDQGLATLVAEELRIRSRDVAFERAVRAAEGVG